MANDLQSIKRETMLQVSNNWVKQFTSFASSSEIKFDDEQKQIIVNSVRKLYESGYDINEYDRNNVADVLYTVAFMRWQPSAMPRHCYFQETKEWEDGQVKNKKLEVKVEGEGNDHVLRLYGVGIKRNEFGEAIGIGKVWIVREFDEFSEGYYNGVEFTPPKWIPKKLGRGDKKGVIMKVVYPITKTDGTTEYWSADREDLQPSIIKHIEQNLSSFRREQPSDFRKFIRELMKMTFDEILEKYDDYELEYKTKKGYTNKVKVIQETYTGPTGEGMILRKLRNIALRHFPKDFKHLEIEQLYEKTFEEKYEKPKIEERVQEKLTIEKEEKANSVVVEALEQEPKVQVVKQETVQKQVKVAPLEVVEPEIEQPKVVEKPKSTVAVSNDIDEDLDEYFK